MNNAEAEEPSQTQTTKNQNCPTASPPFASSLNPEFPFLSFLPHEALPQTF